MPAELVAVIGSLSAVAAAAVTGWLAGRAKRAEGATQINLKLIAPYETLVQQVEDLTSDVSAHTAQLRRMDDYLHKLAQYVDSVIAWEEDGRPDPPGLPPTDRVRKTLNELKQQQQD